MLNYIWSKRLLQRYAKWLDSLQPRMNCQEYRKFFVYLYSEKLVEIRKPVIGAVCGLEDTHFNLVVETASLFAQLAATGKNIFIRGEKINWMNARRFTGAHFWRWKIENHGSNELTPRANAGARDDRSHSHLSTNAGGGVLCIKRKKTNFLSIFQQVGRSRWRLTY